MISYSKRVDAINDDGAEAWQVHSEAHAARNRGEDVVVMSIGDPDFPTADSICDAATQALRDGDTHYTGCAGRQPLREAIAQRHRRLTSVQVQADQIIVTAGAQGGIFSVLQCLCDPGDEVLVPEPAYVTYSAALGAAGARMIRTAPKLDGSFQLDTAALAAAVTSRTRAILFASPNNPTGVIFGPEQINAIADLARQHDLWVICDAVYADLIFDGHYCAIDALPGMAERTITISSVSKSHAMTGWRVGWVIGPKELAFHLENLALCMVYGLPGFVQQGALHALTHGEDEVRRMRQTYQDRRDLVVGMMRDALGTNICANPPAGMFTLIDIRSTGMNSNAFCRALYDDQGVSLIDASTFGRFAQGWARLSFTIGEQELAEGCRRIIRFIEKHRQTG